MPQIDSIPQFEKQDQHGKTVSNETLIGKPSVIYFYPKNFTKGCTAEACSFRDAFEDFQDLGATVIGISQDSLSSHEKFSEEYRLPFQLLSDKDKTLQKLFGVKGDLFGLIPGRETFVFDSQGNLIHHFRSQMKFDQHVGEAIEAIRESQG